MSFANAVRNNAPSARTQNGMRAHASTGSAVLDFFGEVGSARGKDASSSFFAALAEDENLAIRALLWSRDIREGAGERAQFRAILANLDNTNPALAARLMHKVPELGRFDDLFAYNDPTNRSAALEFYASALLDGNGLAFKWAPREKSAKREAAKQLAQVLGMTPRQYRKFLAENTSVTESLMCAKQWAEINFSHVPSVASARYQKAFGRNASEAYTAYIAELKKPQAERAPGVKINAGAVYPHDVVKSVRNGNSAVADEQWNALPNYVGDARILPMVDVSGSMGSLNYSASGQVQPIEVAVALGLYVSSKNTGAFKDIFLTFSNRPAFVTVSGSLTQRIQKMSTAAWEMNTDLHRAFDEILAVAQRGSVRAEDMPQVLLILSDMQFDQCTRYDDSAIQMIARKYEQAGYAVPKIVFWNLNSGYGNVPVKFDSRGVCHVSGFSPSVMKAVLANDLEEYTPYNVMLKALDKDRYAY